MRGYLPEGLERLEQALALPQSRDHPAAAGRCARRRGRRRLLAGRRRSRARPLRAGDRGAPRAERPARAGRGAVRHLASRGRSAACSRTTTPSAPGRIVNEARDIFREIGDDAGVGRCEWALSNVAWGTGRLEESVRHAKEALAALEAVDDRFMVGWVEYTLGLAALSEDAVERGTPEAPCRGAPRAAAGARDLRRGAGRQRLHPRPRRGGACWPSAMAIVTARRGCRRRSPSWSAPAGRASTSGTARCSASSPVSSRPIRPWRTPGRPARQ